MHSLFGSMFTIHFKALVKYCFVLLQVIFSVKKKSIKDITVSDTFVNTGLQCDILFGSDLFTLIPSDNKYIFMGLLPLCIEML